MSIGDATFCFLEHHVGFHAWIVMISSLLTENVFATVAMVAPAPVKIGRCDRAASATRFWSVVRTDSDRALAGGPSARAGRYEALGSITTDTGGNAP